MTYSGGTGRVKYGAEIWESKMSDKIEHGVRIVVFGEDENKEALKHISEHKNDIGWHGAIANAFLLTDKIFKNNGKVDTIIIEHITYP